jgi:hypothetical protein
MANRYDTLYPGQVDAGIAGYPYGRARNVDTPGAGDGTPWEQALVNDIFGFQQALLTEAAITPSNVPDTAALSQYLAAIKKLTRRICCSVALTTPAPLENNDYFTLAVADQSVDAGFTTIVDGVSTLVVPEPGVYFCSLRMALGTTSTDLPSIGQVQVENNATGVDSRIRGTRWSANPGHSFQIVGSCFVNVSNEEDMDRIRVKLHLGETALIDTGYAARLNVIKVTGGKPSTGW